MHWGAGTHDNETMVGWFKDSAEARDKAFLSAYLGSDGSDIAWDMIRESMKSVSMSAIFLLQVLSQLLHVCRSCTALLLAWYPAHELVAVSA